MSRGTSFDQQFQEYIEKHKTQDLDKDSFAILNKSRVKFFYSL